MTLDIISRASVYDYVLVCAIPDHSLLVNDVNSLKMWDLGLDFAVDVGSPGRPWSTVD